MANVDSAAAYRLVPVHPQDSPLLGLSWEDSLLINLMFPVGAAFGTPNIQCNCRCHSVACRAGRSGTHRALPRWLCCSWQPKIAAVPSGTRLPGSLNFLVHSSAWLGLSLASHKTIGPTDGLTCLVITIVTGANELSLSPDKLARLRSLLIE